MKVTETDERDGSVKKKYVEKARYLLYRIPVHRSTPSFDVSVRDLTDKLNSELESLDDQTLNDVLKEAIGRILRALTSDITC